jgi:outer membrane protein TolC
MKTKLFFVLLLSMSLYGQNLSEILQALQNGKKIQATKERLNSKMANAQQFDTYEIPELGIGLSEADEGSESGFEYSVGFSHTLFFPFSSKADVVNSELRKLKEQLEREIRVISLDVASRYHMACVSKEISEMAKSLYDEQQSRFSKLELLYELGEISKKDLLFNKLDLVKLKQDVLSHNISYTTQLGYLQEVVENLDIKKISCDDLEKIRRDIKIKDPQQHSEIRAIHYEQNTAKKLYDMYDSNLRSLSYELLYENELGADRYTFGFSVPLSIFSQKAQKQRLEFLHSSSSLKSQEEYVTLEIKKGTKTLQRKIAAICDQYRLLSDEVLPMSLELKKLAKTALDEGEGTVMEYLDATRSYSENVLEMLDVKQNYYKELFELYKKADLDLGDRS